MKILHRYNELILWEGEAETIKEALSLALRSEADLRGANLCGADLCGADLRGAAFNFTPKINDIHRSIYNAISQPGHSLEMGDWHTCETTHCRAGWVTTLCGEAGEVLESWIGTATAAALIYQASDPTLEKVPDFYASNVDAMEDIKRLAGVVE